MAKASKKTSKKKLVVSDEHKAAMQQGRVDARAVKAYLNHLSNGSRRGRKPSPETTQRKLDQIDTQLADKGLSPIRRLALIQERLEQQERLSRLQDAPNVEELEKNFIKAAAGYSERKGISYAAWRELGVPARVLKEAGVRR